MATKGGGIADFPHLGHKEKAGGGGDPLQEIAGHLRALRAEHVQERLMLSKQFTLAAAGNTDTFDSQTKKVSWIIAQAFTGTVDVYWTDGGGGGSLPPMRFTITPFPIIIPVAVKPYVFTVRANGGPAEFSLTLVA